MGRFLSRQSIRSFNYGIKSIVERSGADVNYKIKSGSPRCSGALRVATRRRQVNFSRPMNIAHAGRGYLSDKGVSSASPNRHNKGVRFAFCIAVFICCIRAPAQPELRHVDAHWVTIQRPARWLSPPPEIGSKIKSGPAQIMVLYPSGAFGYVACSLIRQADGAVSVSRGDGFVVKVGTWKRAKDAVTITSRTVYREIVRRGQSIPGPEVVEQFRVVSGDGTWHLATDSSRFEPMQGFQDLDFLAAVIACDREYYDGEKYLDGPHPCRPPTDSAKGR